MLATSNPPPAKRMPPTESKLLTRFLLPPAPLQTALPLSKFQSLFPPSLHSNPAINTLYASLQAQRDEDVSLVRRNIAAETERGKVQVREVRRERRRRNTGTTDTTSHSHQSEPTSAPHTPTTLAASLTSAQKMLETEIAALEAETERILVEMKATVGDLSDLRYGRFQKTPGAETGLREEVLEAVGRVRGAC
ncbi:hypothetical protein FKW77_008397 [Venturia effusa]|uniref:Uncharacterized protein n=1 Tax=Venturia effusa TaxID=50376 RepID=A0A517LEC1_9PEZI|nr:hypothetical protein FKW77_008397 [Venturia effusa]